MMIDYSRDEFCQKFNPLPHGWQWYSLGECAEILDHERIPINQKERNSRIEGKPLESLYPYYGATGQVGVIDDYIFNEELVLLGEDGAPFLDQGKPKAYLIKGKCWVNNHAHVLRPNPHLLFTSFLCNYLNLFDYSNYVTGTTRLKLNQSRMREIPVLIPPRDIQHNTLTKLESIFTQTRAARAALERVPALLKVFRQSVLAAAFRGKLTERDSNDEPASVLLERIRAERRRRWEEDLRAKGKDPSKAAYAEPPAPDTSKLPELPEGWVWTTLELLLERIEAGHSFRAQGRPAKKGELGVIKVSAMTWGKFLPNENKALLPDTDPGNTPKVCKGDLLISRANTVELVGAVVLVEEDYPSLFLSDKSLRLVPITEEVSKEFLLYALRTRQVRDVFEGEPTGVSESMRNISQDKIELRLLRCLLYTNRQ